MNSFVTGIHPRLHFWSGDAPDGIRTVADLRARARDPANKYLRWFLERLFEDADADVEAAPVIATFKGETNLGASCHSAWYRIKRTGMAYTLTGNEKYFHAAKKQVLAMCDDWCEWVSEPVDPGWQWESDLRTGMALWTVGLAYDWFYHLFTKEERKHLTDAMRERGFRLWLRDKCALTMYGSNWCACVAGGVGIAAMATIEDIPESAELAQLTSRHVPRMLEAFGRDGGWPEGAGYWGGTSLLVEYLDILRSATGGQLDYLKDERLQKTCWFPLYFTMPSGGIANFADGLYSWTPPPIPYAAVAAAHRDPDMQWAVHFAVDRERRGARTLRPDWGQFFLFYDPRVPAKPPDKTVGLSKVFRDIGWIAIRNGWGDDDEKPVIACKAGNNAHGCCQHLDAGNLIANAFGERMLADYGYGCGIPYWTWLSEPDEHGKCRYRDPLYSTVGHNVVVVAGRNQVLRSESTVASYHADDNYGVVAHLDLTNAYEGVAKAERIVIHLRPDILAVLDEFEIEQAQEAWLAWHVPEIELPDDFPENGDISAHLTPIEEGRFRRTVGKGMMAALCYSVTGGPFICSGDAHRRIGMIDRLDMPVKNTIYPYVRVSAGEAKRHVFLSVFAFLPNAAKGTPEWRRVEGGALFSSEDRKIAIIAQPGATVQGVSSDARLAVVDLARHRAAVSGEGILRFDGTRKARIEGHPFVEW